VRTLLAFIALALSVMVALTFGAQNNLVVPLNYLFAKGDFRLSSLLVAFFIAGFILASLLCAVPMMRMQVRLRKLRKQLVNLPVTSDSEKDLSR
jgi:Predicted membrane protein